MKYAFIHVDLILGGAEKLILDMSKVLIKQPNNQITLYTTNNKLDDNFVFDPKIKIEEKFSFLPKTLFNKFKALFSYIRILFLTLYIILFEQKYDVYIVDQISFPLIILKIFRKKTIYYCHYPDYLQDDNNNKGLLKKFYRSIIFWLEFLSIKFCDLILCNSKFTRNTTIKSFNLKNETNIKILYPTCIIDKNLISKGPKKTFHYFLALNRIEFKKNHIFLIKTFYLFIKKYKTKNVKLIFAGGLDNNNANNIIYYQKIKKLIKSLELTENVEIQLNITDKEKINLIKNSICLLYPPINEHFGIVPIEGMALGVPTISNCSGGPLESIENEKTGFLLENLEFDWIQKMFVLLENYLSDDKLNIKENCLKRYNQFFSFEGFEKLFLEILKNY